MKNFLSEMVKYRMGFIRGVDMFYKDEKMLCELRAVSGWSEEECKYKLQKERDRGISGRALINLIAMYGPPEE